MDILPLFCDIDDFWVVDKSGEMIKTIEHGYHHPEMPSLRQ